MADQIKKTETKGKTPPTARKSTEKKETPAVSTSPVANTASTVSTETISTEQFEKLMQRLDQIEKAKDCPPENVIKETFFKEVLQMLCEKKAPGLPTSPPTDLTEKTRADKGLPSRNNFGPGTSVLPKDLEILRRKDELVELKQKIELLCKDSLRFEQATTEIKKMLEQLEKAQGAILKCATRFDV